MPVMYLDRALLFTLNDVRIAVRKMLNVEVLHPTIESELRSAFAGYGKRLHRLAAASATGVGGAQRAALRSVEISSAAKLISFILANGKGKSITRMSWPQIKFNSVQINLRNPSGELVKATERPKRSGGTRWTCNFNNRARGAQRLTEHIILAVAGPSRYEHARKGRGRETAIRETLHSIEQKGVRWFGLLDVKDFFPSITREMVKEALGFLPLSIIKATIFIHDETDTQIRPLYGDKETDSSAFAIRKGIPQGSLVSTLVAGKVLERHVDKLAARHVVAHVDNVLIGGKDGEEVQAKVTALAASFERQPSGSLRLTAEIKRLGDHTMDYLGYRLRRRSLRWGGYGRVTFSERSRRRLHARLTSKLMFCSWQFWDEAIEHECTRWSSSFPSWTNRYQGRDFAVINAYLDLVPIVDAARSAIRAMGCKWSSFAEFAEFNHKLSNRLSGLVPRLHTTGGQLTVDYDRVIKLFLAAHETNKFQKSAYEVRGSL